MSIDEAIHQSRIDVVRATVLVIDSRLSDAIYATLVADFDVSRENHGIYPVLFACANVAALERQRKHGLGAAFVPPYERGRGGRGHRKAGRDCMNLFFRDPEVIVVKINAEY
ncbi:uncharacterized protein METZ01_LOCUS294875 [marine metagenome]|uniref:Uncharacterized protein n=1 Tax=marine metagenome TaxID=408172 RepID=A0A382M466_9ZZZZ